MLSEERATPQEAGKPPLPLLAGIGNDFAIRVNGLSKCYQLYQKPQDRLRQTIYPRVQKLLGQQPKNYATEFWALRDISFEVKRGESVGVIGSNGSGKSTLLQLVCGTLDSTTGSIEVRGRVGALLELGAGFNPEFTGRENVYMSASLYGLTRRAIDDRFDRIAAFADIGQFIEQPVKTYSSGMYLRLAFAVIAHIDADILVVDEALAVGDAIFTQKCMRFIRKFQQQGTLLFVSHDISAVQNLCETAIWLAHGRISQKGPAKDISECYLQYCLQETYGKDVELKSTQTERRTVEQPSERSGDARPPLLDYQSEAVVERNVTMAKGWKTGIVEVVDVTLSHADGGTEKVFLGGERVRIAIRAKANKEIEHPILGFLVRDRLGQDLFGENTLPFTDLHPRPMQAGQEIVGTFIFRLPMLPNGQYAVMASIADGDRYNNVQHHWLHDALIIHISSSTVRYGLVGVPFEHVSVTYF